MAWHRLRETEIDVLVHAEVLQPERRGKPDAILNRLYAHLGQAPRGRLFRGPAGAEGVTPVRFSKDELNLR
jgi:hypothetical protein